MDWSEIKEVGKEDLQTVLAKIPKLSHTELKTAQLALQHIDESTKTSNEDQEEAELCFEMIRKTMSNEGLSCPPWNGFKRTPGYQSYKKHYPELKVYIEQQFGVIKRQKRQKLYRILAELMIAWMRDTELPLRQTIFFRNIDKVPQLVSKAFPGYAAEGWLPLILEWGNRRSGV